MIRCKQNNSKFLQGKTECSFSSLLDITLHCRYYTMSGINTDGNIGSISFDSFSFLRGFTSLLNTILTTTNSKGPIALCLFLSACYSATLWCISPASCNSEGFAPNSRICSRRMFLPDETDSRCTFF